MAQLLLLLRHSLFSFSRILSFEVRTCSLNCIYILILAIPSLRMLAQITLSAFTLPDVLYGDLTASQTNC